LNYLLDDTISYYKSIITRWFEIDKTLDSEKYLMMKFEDMISSPHEKMEAMCKFGGIQMEEAMLTVYLSKSNINRWKQEFG